MSSISSSFSTFFENCFSRTPSLKEDPCPSLDVERGKRQQDPKLSKYQILSSKAQKALCDYTPDSIQNFCSQRRQYTVQNRNNFLKYSLGILAAGGFLYGLNREMREEGSAIRIMCNLVYIIWNGEI